ncbi:hypothetical protein Btru_073553 [Bulinus truncatus]|nr:hypothetical protein Btru_073553 [Bulinus truncatus]
MGFKHSYEAAYTFCKQETVNNIYNYNDVVGRSFIRRQSTTYYNYNDVVGRLLSGTVNNQHITTTMTWWDVFHQETVNNIMAKLTVGRETVNNMITTHNRRGGTSFIRRQSTTYYNYNDVVDVFQQETVNQYSYNYNRRGGTSFTRRQLINILQHNDMVGRLSSGDSQEHIKTTMTWWEVFHQEAVNHITTTMMWWDAFHQGDNQEHIKTTMTWWDVFHQETVNNTQYTNDVVGRLFIRRQSTTYYNYNDVVGRLSS